MITFEEAKKSGCRYCDLRHFMCGYPSPYDENGWKECQHFVLGKCFNCAVFVGNNGEPVEGVCSDVYDFGGCENYKE